MSWVLLAVLAHAGNALVFALDKSLLGSSGRIGEPIRYTFYSGVVAGAAGLLLLAPGVFAPPAIFTLMYSAAAATFYLLALWLFFSALKEGEPSRVVPIAGSTVPLFTLLFAVTALGELLALRHVAATVLLVLGGASLSIRLGSARGLPARALILTLGSGIFFAAYFATMKFLYDNAEPFLTVFAYSRVVQAVLALLVLGPVMLTTGPRVVRTKRQRTARSVPMVFFGNKILAAGAFLLQSYAISLGSVTVVNALQGTQYLILLLIAAAVSAWWPNLFREEFSRIAVWQKISGVLLVSLGIALLI